MVAAADRMLLAAVPRSSTPPRKERLEVFEEASSNLARLISESDIFLKDPSPSTYHAIIPLGIYATREALSSLTSQDRVDAGTSKKVSQEIQDVCDFTRRRLFDPQPYGDTLGMSAELGIANMLWRGIGDGILDAEYALLLGNTGKSDNCIGAKKDTDILLKSSRSRFKLQVKASERRARSIYSQDITVVTAQGLVGTRSTSGAVRKLLSWDRANDDLKYSVYRRLVNQVGIRFL